MVMDWLRRQKLLLGMALVAAFTIVVAGGGGVEAQGAGPQGKGGPGAPSRTFGNADIDDAIASGRLDPEVVESLAASGEAEALVVLNYERLDRLQRRLRAERGLSRNDQAVVAALSKAISSMQRRAAGAARGEISVLNNYQAIPVQHVTFKSVGSLVAYLRSPDVTGIRANRTNEVLLGESLPLVNQPAVEAAGLTGAGTTVSVLDTGVDYTHPAFGTCSQPGDPGCSVLVSLDTGVPDDSQLDSDGHGTNVSATVLGVAPGAMLVVHDVFGSSGAPDSAVLAAIDWSIAYRDVFNIVAINMSLGGGAFADHCFPNGYYSAVQQARASGISVVVASGNNAATKGISHPACTPGAFSVGAVYDSNMGGIAWSVCNDSTTAADKITCFSNGAYFLSALAPGALITAADITAGGTSQAAPHVAGAVAVLRQLGPFAPLADIEEALIACGPTITDNRSGAGGRQTHRLDLSAAVDHLSGVPCATGPGPANDHFNSATLIGSSVFADSVVTTNATNEPADPFNPCGGIPHGRTVWYSFTPGLDGLLDISTAGSSYDTLLSVWTGAPDSLSIVACNDDAADLTSEVLDVPVDKDVTYYIQVAGFQGGSGTMNLSVSFEAQVYCRGVLATIVGTNGPDNIVGTAGDDVIAALDGDDIIDGGAGNDLICAGSGDDTVNGGDGKDLIYGQRGNDTLFGDAGPDRLYGGPGIDILYGGIGYDKLYGGADNDELYGEVGNDEIKGGGGNDLLDGADGTDTLDGGNGFDTCLNGETVTNCEA